MARLGQAVDRRRRASGVPRSPRRFGVPGATTTAGPESCAQGGADELRRDPRAATRRRARAEACACIAEHQTGDADRAHIDRPPQNRPCGRRARDRPALAVEQKQIGATGEPRQSARRRQELAEQQRPWRVGEPGRPSRQRQLFDELQIATRGAATAARWSGRNLRSRQRDALPPARHCPDGPRSGPGWRAAPAARAPRRAQIPSARPDGAPAHERRSAASWFTRTVSDHRPSASTSATSTSARPRIAARVQLGAGHLGDEVDRCDDSSITCGSRSIRSTVATTSPARPPDLPPL